MPSYPRTAVFLTSTKYKVLLGLHNLKSFSQLLLLLAALT